MHVPTAHPIAAAAVTIATNDPSSFPAGLVVTIISGLAILLRPDSALWGLLQPPSLSEAAKARMEGVCRSDGWLVSAVLQPPPEPRGRATKLLFGDKPCPSARSVLELLALFELDEAAIITDPAGPVRLLRESRWVNTRGPWTAFVDDNGVATAVQWRLTTSTELRFGDDSGSSGPSGTLQEGTTLQFDGLLRAGAASGRIAALTEGAPSDAATSEGLIICDGRIRVQVPSQLSLTLGVAEFRTVGTFSARPAPRRTHELN